MFILRYTLLTIIDVVFSSLCVCVCVGTRLVKTDGSFRSYDFELCNYTICTVL